MRRTTVIRRQVVALIVVAAGLTLAGATQAATQLAPVNTAPPTVSGTTTVGHTLTASNGTWSNSPTSYAQQWLRCNGSGAGCVAVANGTQQSYTLVGADAGHTMRVRVTASNADGSASARSDPTAGARGRSRRCGSWAQRCMRASAPATTRTRT